MSKQRECLVTAVSEELGIFSLKGRRQDANTRLFVGIFVHDV